MSKGEFVLYSTDDGRAQLYLRAEGGSVWLTQLELANLFQTTKQNVSLHIRNALREGELDAGAVVKEDLTTAADGKRYRTQLYSLDLILAVGYRVRSPRGTQFRQWATTHLREYLIKGFVMDDARLKEPEGWDYFDELLQRIREIRTSEKRFYQKVRELFALSTDYHNDAEAVSLFFAEVQNKMLFAVTRLTAAEIVVQRADPTQPNMALTSWKAGHVRKMDVVIAKNYLSEAEVEELNRIASMFLDYAEDRARRRQGLRVADWRQYVNSFLQFNERPLLLGSGKISHERMEQVAHQRYAEFDAKRRAADASDADATDLLALKQAERLLFKKKGE
ncbi:MULTISPECIES: virulence RhuM family protein [unclassified Variovorax]|uniref:virulence RhuM family protein n=1 Tax=unclassified Variovorax TaxID=663243 RepID=UPI00076BE38C|nr:MULTISPECIES: virulence RhuM family protein [unclassified Variovorax]KWT97619.1 putative DNA-binding protein in cluster with Type I restriction-modification system [Variovorax sp. WDL1]PNG58652.1 hypothetical protein CHC07_00377 [Variovorax sp. B4]PNG61558.1 hypothetical protein CHC06_01459 [Variovorax sp. B2]VTV12412.1 Virulence protein [Variovorax sp. WDL1]